MKVFTPSANPQPLDEYVYIPKYKTYTKNKVPVGINK